MGASKLATARLYYSWHAGMPPGGVQVETTVSVVSRVEAGDEETGAGLSVADEAAAASARSWSGEVRRLARLLLGRFVTDEPTGGAFALDFTDGAAVQALFEEGSGSLLTDGEVLVSPLAAQPPTGCNASAPLPGPRVPAWIFSCPLPLHSRRLSLVHGSISSHVQRAARRTGRRPGPADADG
jgi:hypothetical protein